MSEFKPGDRVQWMFRNQQGRSLVLETQTGAIVSIEGQSATIVPDFETRKVLIPLANLRPVNVSSAVNDIVQEVFRRNRARNGRAKT